MEDCDVNDIYCYIFAIWVNLIKNTVSSKEYRYIMINAEKSFAVYYSLQPFYSYNRRTLQRKNYGSAYMAIVSSCQFELPPM